MHSLQKLQLYRNLECELFVQRTVYSARCFKHFISLRELYDTSDDLPKKRESNSGNLKSTRKCKEEVTKYDIMFTQYNSFLFK